VLPHSGRLGPLEVLLTQYLVVQQLQDSGKKIHDCDYAVEITSTAQLLPRVRDSHKYSQIAFTELTTLKCIYHYLRLLGWELHFYLFGVVKKWQQTQYFQYLRFQSKFCTLSTLPVKEDKKHF